MAHQAMGDAMTIASSTSFTKSLESMPVICVIPAPSTFLMPISLFRCSAINADRANNPRQAMIMASTAKPVKIRTIRNTSAYMDAKRSSRNVYRIGWLGEKFFQTVLMEERPVSYTHLTLPTNLLCVDLGG